MRLGIRIVCDCLIDEYRKIIEKKRAKEEMTYRLALLYFITAASSAAYLIRIVLVFNFTSFTVSDNPQ